MRFPLILLLLPIAAAGCGAKAPDMAAVKQHMTSDQQALPAVQAQRQPGASVTNTTDWPITHGWMPTPTWTVSSTLIQ